MIGTPKAYMLILDANKNVLAKYATAPFSNTTEALEWLETTVTLIDTTISNEQAFQNAPENVDLMTVLASSYYTLHRFSDFENLCAKLFPLLDDKESNPIKQQLLVATFNNELASLFVNQGDQLDFKDSFPKTRALTLEVVEHLIEEENDEVFDLLFDETHPILVIAFKDNPIELASRLFKAFPESKEVGSCILQVAPMTLISQDPDLVTATHTMLKDFLSTPESKNDPKFEQVNILFTTLEMTNRLAERQANQNKDD